MTHYIIENETAIWGVGDTEEAAWRDMERMAGASDPDQYSRDNFSCEYATDALVAEVRERGGAIAWGQLPDGTRCTVAEEEASQNQPDESDESDEEEV